jgi:hypothetical protein
VESGSTAWDDGGWKRSSNPDFCDGNSYEKSVSAICRVKQDLPLTRQPDGAPAAVSVFRNMGHNIKAIPVEQQAVFVGVEAGMIEGFPFQRAYSFAKGGTARE